MVRILRTTLRARFARQNRLSCRFFEPDVISLSGGSNRNDGNPANQPDTLGIWR